MTTYTHLALIDGVVSALEEIMSRNKVSLLRFTTKRISMAFLLIFMFGLGVPAVACDEDPIVVEDDDDDDDDDEGEILVCKNIRDVSQTGVFETICPFGWVPIDEQPYVYEGDES